MTPLALFNLGPGEWAVIAVLVLLLFGASRIPQVARALGRARGDFERGKTEGERDAGKAADEAELLRTARDLGVPTDGRPIEDVRRDVEAKRKA